MTRIGSQRIAPARQPVGPDAIKKELNRLAKYGLRLNKGNSLSATLSRKNALTEWLRLTTKLNTMQDSRDSSVKDYRALRDFIHGLADEVEKKARRLDACYGDRPVAHSATLDSSLTRHSSHVCGNVIHIHRRGTTTDS